MPEIKHNFMKGKMNKDLDERLVPNGEYRDALNIQVSTSEGSDVGTVQNILGNSLIAGQDFMSEQAVCVASIADEKNDKLYYFITDHEEFITNPDLLDATNWSIVNPGATEVGSGTHSFNDDGSYSQLRWNDGGYNLIDGETYHVEIEVDSIVADANGDLPVIRHNNGVLGTEPFLTASSVGRHISTFVADTSVIAKLNLIQKPYGASTVISYVSLKTKKDLILEYDTNTKTITPVFVDVVGDVLKFNSNNIVTGINIIDDLLLWTDNENEPRKINIARCKAGTDVNGLTSTDLIVEGNNEGLIKEEHITVIKRPPSKPPNLTTKTVGRTGFIEGDLKNQYHFHPMGNSYEPVVDGDEMWVGVDTGGTNANPILLDLEVGDILRVYEGWGGPTIDDSTGLKQTPIARLLIKELQNSDEGIETRVSQVQNNFASSTGNGDVIAWSHEAALRVSVASYVTHSYTNRYSFELEQEQVGIFERKFPRFACRYKYEDNEYSSVGPFSEVVFFPGEFEYHPTKAYNKGMVNNLKELTLSDFIAADIPTDVVGIDLLYKNEFSPNIYVVKSIYKSDDEWDVNNTSDKYNKYVIKTENVYAQIPSNQLTRPWDNVPKTALAQEVTGNRVVYGNYMQGYDLLAAEGSGGHKITPVINATQDERLEQPLKGSPVRSVKSQRTYNLGVVYGDKYGRETPVFTNESAYQFIAKPSSATANAIVASVETEHPHWAEYYKMYIKETANEYYNLPMGRVYDAKDGNVWISFPSIDRNKIDEDTYLILKKGVGEGDQEDEDGNNSGNKAVLDEARYKVVAIENEAPDYIKTEYTVLAETTKKITGATLFGGNSQVTGSADFDINLPAEGPFPGTKSFTISKKWWEHTGSQDHELGLMPLTSDEGTGIWDTRRDSDIYVSFSNVFKLDGVGWSDSPIIMSNKYRVTSVELIPEDTAATGYSGHDLYRVTVAETIPQSESWLTEYFAVGNDISHYNKGGKLRPHFYKEEVKNKPEFDGRFFVKIIEDEALAAALKVEEETPEDGYLTISAINNLYHLKDGTHSGETGQEASKTRQHWVDNLGGENNDRWFIDATAFAGVQPADKNHPKHSVVKGGTTGTVDLCDTDSPTAYANFNKGALIDWTDGSGPNNNNYPGYHTEGYHAPYLEVVTRNWGTGASTGLEKLRGVHEASYGAAELTIDHLSGYSAGTDLYLSLSYSGIEPKPNGDPYTIGTKAADDNFAARQYRGYFWNAFEENKNWGVGVSSNSATSNQAAIVKNLKDGKMFRLRGNTTVYKILGVTKRRLYNYMGKIRWDDGAESTSDSTSDSGVLTEILPNQWHDNPQYTSGIWMHHLGGYYGTQKNWGNAGVPSNAPNHLVNTINPIYLDDYVHNENENTLQTGSDPWLHYTAKHFQHKHITKPLNCRVNYLIKYEVVVGTGPATSLADNDQFTPTNMNATSSERFEFVEEFSTTKQNTLTEFPAIFETEPKEDVGLDIYYEASGKKPTNVTSLNIHNLITIGAVMQIGVPGSGVVNEGVFVTGITKVDGYPNSWRIDLSMPNQADYYGDFGIDNEGTEIRFYNDDGSFAITNLQQVITPGGGAFYVSDDGTFYQREATGSTGSVMSSSIIVMMSSKIGLGWFNCWSFGNGVESNRIGDTYNKPYITNGVKASTTLLEDYKEERRKYGLIYSGIYNSTSGVNDLNQFIAAEKITKDINPIYGSIQKLHSRSSADGDLITLCEDRILKILASKDALYNADGSPQLIASNNVLGQAMPFSGEFGISQNPESFASESYRIYFTDKVRGAVMRLSRDGLTPISDHGMKDWFRDNLKLSTKLIGSYDDKNDEYNITLANRVKLEEIISDNYLEDTLGWVVDNPGVTQVGSGTHTFGNNDTYSSLKWQSVDLIHGQKYQVEMVVDSVRGEGIVRYNNGVPGTEPTLTASSVGRHISTFNADTSQSTKLTLYHYPYTSGVVISYVSCKQITSDPTTVSFKEDVKGWVSFKSFTPENALSMANDYYTMLGGKLYQHDNENVYRNNFYGVDYNSSVNVLLNDMPGSIKSYHTLGYEGSQSRVEGIKTIKVTGIEFYNSNDDGRYFFFEEQEANSLFSQADWYAVGGGASNTDKIVEMKQYRNNTLIHTGLMLFWNNDDSNSTASLSGGPTKGFGRRTMDDGNWGTASNPGDFQVGDVITTQLQENSVNHFNSTPKDGWYVGGVKTNNEEGSLLEFIEKEGKWFNYIKGVESEINETTDFGSFDIQGLGMIQSIDNNDITINGDLNASVQVGDIVYYEQPSQVLEDSILDMNVFSSGYSQVYYASIGNTSMGSDQGFVITADDTVVWNGLSDVNAPSSVNYFNNITTENITIGDTYLGTLTVSNYNGTGSLGFSASGGVSGSLRLASDGTASAYFVATANTKPDFFARTTNSGTMKGSIQKVVAGGMLGFTQIESNQLQKAGVITGINNNVITIDDSGTLPSQSDYCMFIKNQVINMNGLSGYYADAMFENNSKIKAELFAVSSETTESSK